MKKKLKVIQIIDSLNVGGAEMLAVNIANGLLEQNIESHLCVTRKEGDLQKNIHKNVGYVFLIRTSIFDIKAVLKLKNYIKKNEITVVHAHSTSSFIAFLMKILNPKIRLIWHNHSGAYLNLNGIKLSVLKIISIKIDFIISVNKDLEKWGKNRLHHHQGKYVPNFPSFDNKSKSTKLYGLEGKRIVLIAGLRPVKDHLNALKAFQIVLKNHPNWTLHLIGKDYQDDYAHTFKTYIKENHLEKKVFLYGVRSDIQHILSQATIGVLSSKSEGLPVSLLEYGLAKLPVVVTNVGECASVVKDTNALVTPTRNDMFALKLEKMMVDVALREEIATTLHNNVLNNYSKKAVISTLIDIYKNC